MTRRKIGDPFPDGKGYVDEVGGRFIATCMVCKSTWSSDDESILRASAALCGHQGLFDVKDGGRESGDAQGSEGNVWAEAPTAIPAPESSAAANPAAPGPGVAEAEELARRSANPAASERCYECGHDAFQCDREAVADLARIRELEAELAETQGDRDKWAIEAGKAHDFGMKQADRAEKAEARIQVLIHCDIAELKDRNAQLEHELDHMGKGISGFCGEDCLLRREDKIKQVAI